MKIGIDLGGSHIGVGLVNDEGKIISKIDTELNSKKVADIKEFIVKLIINTILQLLNENKITLDNIKLIGIGVPGETENGVIKKLVNLGIENFNIVKMLKQGLNFKNIIIKNDGKCAAIAEKMYGSMKEFQDTVFLCLGTGIGGAAFLNDELLRPKKHSGFEFRTYDYKKRWEKL